MVDEYKDLLDRLHQGEIGSQLLNSPAWTSVMLIAQGIADMALLRSMKIDPIKDPGLLIRMQVKAELYGEFVQNIAKVMYKEGNEAFELMQELGLDKNLFAVASSENGASG